MFVFIRLFVVISVVGIFAFVVSRLVDMSENPQNKIEYKKTYEEILKDKPNILACLRDSDCQSALNALPGAKDDKTIVQNFITLGADVNARDEHGVPALFKQSSPTIVKMLIDAGADVNARDAHGRSVLMAYCKGDPEIVQLLVNAGVDVNVKDENGKTILMHANASVADVLIQSKAFVDDVDNDGRTALHNCAEIDKAALLINAGASLEAVDLVGNTPILTAASTEIVRILLESGANIKAKNNSGKNILMTKAIVSRDIFIKAIMNEVEINGVCSEEDGEEFSVLMVILRMSDEIIDRSTRLERIEALIRAKADVNFQNNKGRSPLMCTSDPAIIRRLVKVGADPCARDLEGNTSLMYARTKDAVEALVQAGTPVNGVNKQGQTPLMFAKTVEVARALLDAGADRSIALPNGLIAEDVACNDVVKNAIRAYKAADV